MEDRHAEAELYSSVGLAQLALDNSSFKLILLEQFGQEDPAYAEKKAYLTDEIAKRKDYLLKLYEKVQK